MNKVTLINPSNPVVSLTQHGKRFGMNKFRTWKPLSLLTLAKVTPSEWDVEVIDENLYPLDLNNGIPRPDLVGITAFTSQATRAYKLADYFRSRNIPVVMGGIHASFCKEEALQYADSVVLGEAETVWPELLSDFKNNKLQKVYTGGLVPNEKISGARHDILSGEYFVGAIQTTRGCPLRCTFCSVTSFNGGAFRHRPIEHVIQELKEVRERFILFVDDNLVGVHATQMNYTKELLKEIIKAKINKPWFTQVTINVADDDELLYLLRRAGCLSVFIGFESPTEEGLKEVHKKFNMRNSRDFKKSVNRIQKNNITVVGSFIMGTDVDISGISRQISQAATEYGVDAVNTMIATPLPGTVMYKQLDSEKRITAVNYPEDWQYYTLAHPVMEYKNFTWSEIVDEMEQFNRSFYTIPKILHRVFNSLLKNWNKPRNALVVLISNVSYLYNHILDKRVYTNR